MSIVRILVGILCATCISAQVITTVAGTDFVFPSPVAAVNAPLGNVSSVATDANGNVYAADSANRIIVKISPASGNLTVVAGNGLLDATGDGISATSATLSQPGLVALDSAGNIYFYDAGRVREISNGIVTTIAGVYPDYGFSGDGGPATSALIDYGGGGLVVDSAGAVYISDNDTCRVRKIANGIINTVAGNGQCAFSGDGGPAASASLNSPGGIALDLNGNLYIADGGNGRIRKVSGGIITTIAGGPNGDTSGSLSAVTGIALDSSGNLYIAVYSANRIFKVTGGVLTPYAGNGNMGLAGDGSPALSASLNNPYGIALDASGNLYIADVGNQRIRKVTAATGNMGQFAGNGGFKFSGDGGPASIGIFNQPTSVAVDAAGNLYIADYGNNRIRKVSNGIVTTFAGNGVPAYAGDNGPAANASLNQPFAVAVDSSGALYIADYGNNVVRKVASGTITTVAGTGIGGYSGDGGPAKAATLANPAGIAVDLTGNIYIADAGNDVIRRVSNGIISTVAGNGMQTFSGDGGPANKASLQINTYYFAGIAVDSIGNLYIADTGNARVRVVSGGNGTITTFAGNGQQNSSGDGGPATGAGLNPSGLALDPDGSLYIADSNNNYVRKVSNGTITTIAGNGSYSFSGDGAPAIQAGINGPVGLALDSAGNLFIAEPSDGEETLLENGHIREVLKTAPSFQVSTAALSFSAISRGPSPAAKVATLTSSFPNLQFTTSVSAGFLSVSPSSGSMPATLQVSVDPSQLDPGGPYTATVSIGATNVLQSQTLTVIVNVKPPVPGLLVPSSQTLSFAVTQNASPETSQLTLSNTGSVAVQFTTTATSNGGSWLQVSPSSGTVSAAAPASLTVTANPAGLAAGTYSGAIIVFSADTGQNLTIPVTLAINAPQPQILLSQSGLTFTAVAQGGNPLSQSLAVLNTGAGTLNFTAAASLSSSGWLSVSPGSGTVNRPFLDAAFLDVSVDASALVAGTYYGQIQVTGAGASNSPQVVTVALIVLPAGSNPGPDVSPIGLVFTTENPAPQSIAVANLTAGAITFGSGVAPSTETFLQYRPQAATVLPNAPVNIDISADFGQLPPGPNRATLTLAFFDGTNRTVDILAVVPASGASTQSRESPKASGCTPTKLLPEFTLVGSSSNVTLGFPATVAAMIVDDCGMPLTAGSVVVSFSNGDAQLSLLYVPPPAGMTVGTWTNTWLPGNSATNVTLTLRANMPALNLQGTTQAASVTLLQGSLTPPMLSGGPLGAGSLAQGPFAPGDVMLIRGSGLADGQSSATATPLQNTLAGASLVIGSKTASLLYVDSGQVIGLVPANVLVNSSQQVLLVKDNTFGSPVSVIIAPTHPAILTADASGKGQGLAYNAGAAATTLADGTNPVAVGGAVIIYCTGLGQTDSTGRVSNAVNMSIGGQPAQVSYAGVAVPQAYPPSGAPMLLGLVSGGLGGLYQVTATVPGGLVNGPNAVMISSAGQTSQSGVTLTVTGGGSPSGGIPAIMAVVNAATGQVNDAKHGVAPNSFISVYSSNIGTSTNLNLFPATNFQGIEVLFNGNPVPLYAVAPSANQINLVVPSELQGSGTATVTVQNSTSASPNMTVTLAPDSVGVFRIPDAAHPNNAAVELAGTLEVVLPASTAATYGFPSCTTPVTSTCAQPAKPGDNIVIYFTGGGLATPNGNPSGQPVPTGSVAPVNGNPLYKTIQTPTLTIGGLPAAVQFSGIAPGTAAEYQLNTQIPLGVQSGDSVPVVLNFPNSSDSVTIAVRAP